jgi:phosphatidylinositol alpha-mannosyltransferase
MSRVVISCYEHEENPRCGTEEAAAVREIAHLLSRKHEVVVISGSFQGCRREGTEPFQRIYLPTGWAGPRAGKPLFRLLLASAARRIRHDLWIESLPDLSTGIIPRVTSQPVVALVHMLPTVNKTRRHTIPFGFYQRQGLAGYRQLVVLNEADRDFVTCGRRDVSYTVIPGGVYLPDDPPPPGEGDHILFLGRINVNQKGLDLLLAAIAAAKPGLPVLLAGAGPPAEESKLIRLLQQTCGPIARVGHISGPAKDVLLRNCAFVVLPSRCEAFGLAALEAMARGKPVVYFDLPQLRWLGTEAAIRVPAFDVDSFAAAVRTLASDDVQRASMGRAARETAERYSRTEIGRRHLDIIDACLSRPHVPGEV